MITLPDAEPITPDLRSPDRYLLRLARLQWPTLLRGVLLGIGWMTCQALLPAVLGRTVDAGVVARDGAAVATGCTVMAGLAAGQAVFGVTRHRAAVMNWWLAALRTAQLLGHRTAHAGPAVTARTTTGELVSTVSNDAMRIGEIYDVSARFSGAVVSFGLVSALVLRVDLSLGLTVLVGVPALTALLTAVIRPLQARRTAHRETEGRLTALGSDTVAGLRVLRGFGGERQFVARYVERSTEVRRAGVRVAVLQATLDAAHVALPGAFAVLLTWLGARAAVSGRITAGELVTLYGYAAFLVMPLSTATETLGKLVRARVGAARVVAVLRLRAVAETEPPAPDPWPGDGSAGPDGSGPDGSGHPPRGAAVEDPASGLRVGAGELVALVGTDPEAAARLADRLARFEADRPADGADAPTDAGPAAGRSPSGGSVATPGIPAPRLDGVPVDAVPVAALRRRVLVSEPEPRLFTGTLREQVDPAGRHPDRAVLGALQVADAGDLLDALPEGLAGAVTERGRSLSGGQRQRVALARAVLADPDLLVLVEPTSAVDAHTEARIADRLRAARAGRTTLVLTSSPLLLDRADRVAFLDGDRVAATGPHHELLDRLPRYRDTVTRGEEEP